MPFERWWQTANPLQSAMLVIHVRVQTSATRVLRRLTSGWAKWLSIMFLSGNDCRRKHLTRDGSKTTRWVACTPLRAAKTFFLGLNNITETLSNICTRIYRFIPWNCIDPPQIVFYRHCLAFLYTASNINVKKKTLENKNNKISVFLCYHVNLICWAFRISCPGPRIKLY